MVGSVKRVRARGHETPSRTFRQVQMADANCSTDVSGIDYDLQKGAEGLEVLDLTSEAKFLAWCRPINPPASASSVTHAENACGASFDGGLGACRGSYNFARPARSQLQSVDEARSAVSMASAGDGVY